MAMAIANASRRRRNAARTIRSPSMSSTRKGRRWSTSRGPGGPRSSSSAASRSCSRPSSWTPARSCSTPPTTTTRSRSARSCPAATATPTSRSPTLAGAGRSASAGLANLGASYPEIVAVLETAQRQKNLAGELVVDAVPVSNRQSTSKPSWAKTSTAKRDDAVKRTSGESSELGRRRFFGLFGGDSPPPSKNRASRKLEPDRKLQRQRSLRRQGTAAPAQMPPTPATAAEPLSKSRHRRQERRHPGRASRPPAKKDDAVARTSDSRRRRSVLPRRRLF